MFRHIRTRLIIIVCAIAVVALLGVATVDLNQKIGLQSVLEERRTDEAAWFERIIKLNGRSLAMLAYDYSFWDDMVKFVTSRDSLWATENIDISLTTYNTDAAWVLRPDGQLQYFVESHECDQFDQQDVLRWMPIERLRAKPFMHFFATTRCGIIEVRTAPIQPSSDEERKTPAQGYFVVGKIWNSEYLDSLKVLTNTDLRLLTAESLVASDTLTACDPLDGQLRFNWILAGADHRPLAVLVCTSQAPFVMDFINSANRTVLVVGSIATVFILILWIAMTRWVTRPLRHVSNGLQTRDASALSQLKASGTEFAEIGVLLERFKEAETALSESQRSLQTLFANLPGLAYRCANDPSWTMEVVSDGCVELTGYTSAELLRNRVISYADLIHPDDRMMVWNDVQSGIQLQRPFHLTYRIRDRFGKIKWLEEHGRGIFNDQGSLVALEGFITDITERIKAESEQSALQEQLTAARRMESLGLLAGGVAHDLNNMLGPLVAYPEMILGSLPPDSEIRDQIELLGTSATKAAAVIQDLLTLARRGRYEMHPTDINTVIKEYLQSPTFQQLRARRPAVNLNCYLDEELPMINGSTPHLFKVVMNLVTNAYDAVADGGDLTIRTSAPYLHETPAGAEPVPVGQYVALRISDTGTGIPETDLPHIFEPYFSTKQIGSSGTGLGLAVVYGTIKDHKGTVEVISRVGQGTSFILYLPVSFATEQTSPEQRDEYTGTGNILVVDDVPEQRQVAIRLLANLGYSVVAVDNGDEAITYVRNHQIDLAVIDMQLTGDLDGFDTYLEIHTIQPQAGAVIISGYASTARVQLAMDCGVHSFVAKPYTRESLGKAVCEAMAARSILAAT